MEQTLPFDVERCKPNMDNEHPDPKCKNCMRLSDHPWQTFEVTRIQSVMCLDPGTNTGVAMYIGGKLSTLTTIDPSQIQNHIREFRPDFVIYEDSRLQSNVWCAKVANNRASQLKIARNLGEIDAWCKLIASVCGWSKTPAHGISPQNKGKKLDAKKFYCATGWDGRSNQHERDAAMLFHASFVARAAFATGA